MDPTRIEIKCASGHRQDLALCGYNTERGQALAALLDGSSPLYQAGPDTVVGTCAQCQAPLACTLVYDQPDPYEQGLHRYGLFVSVDSARGPVEVSLGAIRDSDLVQALQRATAMISEYLGPRRVDGAEFTGFRIAKVTPPASAETPPPPA